jgi:hypothetical protein
LHQKIKTRENYSGIFAPWELQYAADINRAQPVKEEFEVPELKPEQTEQLLCTRTKWRNHYGRKVLVNDSEARFVSKYADTGKSRFLFSEDQTEPLLHTRKQWEQQHSRRVVVDNSQGKQINPHAGRAVYLFTIEQTVPLG